MTTVFELQALTKTQLIAKLLEGQTEEKTETEFFPSGELKRQVRKVYDAYGKPLSEQVVAWTYYPTGEVDMITLTEGGKVRVIKHFIDGRQPVVEKL